MVLIPLPSDLTEPAATIVPAPKTARQTVKAQPSRETGIVVGQQVPGDGEDGRKIEQPGRARCSRSLAEASSRGSAAGSSHNEVANTCQTGAFGQMKGRWCLSVGDRATCSIKLWPG